MGGARWMRGVGVGVGVVCMGFVCVKRQRKVKLVTSNW